MNSRSFFSFFFFPFIKAVSSATKHAYYEDFNKKVALSKL